MDVKLFLVGNLVKTKGLDGTLKLNAEIENIDALLNAKTLFIENETYKVTKIYEASNGIFVRFENIDTIEKAENFLYKQVYISEIDMPKLQENEKYVTDLIGAYVFLSSGEKVGKLVNIENYGATDIAIINTRRNELMVPIIDGLIESLENDSIVLNAKIFKEVTEE